MKIFSDKFTRAIVLCCAFMLPIAVSAEQQSDEITDDGALILEHADQNENFYSSATGEFISHLRGNVVFRFEDLRISSDEARWQRSAGIVNFSRNVRAEQRGQLLTCERLHFVRDNNLLTATRNVVYQDSARITTIRGHTAEYMTNTKEAVLHGNPLLTRFDSSSDTDTTFLRGRKITYNDSTKIATVIDNVNIRRGELTATGQIGYYFANTNTAQLRVNPIIHYETHKIVGDSVDLVFNDEALESAFVVGNTHGIYREAADTTADTTVTNIWSDRMHMYMFESGKVRSIKAFGNARGNHANAPNDSIGNTMSTDISSDSLHVFMFEENGKIRAIRAYGNAHGRNAEWSPASETDTSITHIWGDSLRISMTDEGRMRLMRAFGNAQSKNFVVGDSARANEVSGQIMTLIFNNNGKIERAVVTGNAKSLYHLEEGEGGGSNNATGDQIIVMFRNGRAQKLQVRGNVKGFYSP
ncbi:MAG: hypothetical protein LBU70_04440 [Chitinispirillales bacterium]|jgi:lipopolysaccharide export system protein LptA|nr:hypothetical protein [Chitinispirillales bacterium]